MGVGRIFRKAAKREWPIQNGRAIFHSMVDHLQSRDSHNSVVLHLVTYYRNKTITHLVDL